MELLDEDALEGYSEPGTPAPGSPKSRRGTPGHGGMLGDYVPPLGYPDVGSLFDAPVSFY